MGFGASGFEVSGLGVPMSEAKIGTKRGGNTDTGTHVGLFLGLG